MKKENIKFNKLKLLGVLGISCLGYLAFISPHESVEAMKSVATHIGTFEGSTTFTTSSSNGINPGLFIEVMDEDGNLTQYESEEGVIAIPDTKEGAYVTQAKLLGKTKYVDEDTGEVLDQFEEGRNLRLESAQMPVLSTCGKNLFNRNGKLFDGWLHNGGIFVEVIDGGLWTTDFIEIKNESYISFSGINSDFISFAFFDGDYNMVGSRIDNVYTVQIPMNAKYIRITFNKSDTDTFQIEYGNKSTSYEPHKTNILTVNEDVTLRGVGDVKDELDLMTGKYVQRIGKTTITGDLIPTVTSWERNNNSETMCFESFGGIIPFQWNQIISADWPITWEEFNPSLTHEYFNPHGGHGIFRIKRSRLETEDANGFKKWLNENPITIYHPVIGSESIKTVALNSNYFFKPINKDSIQVTGTITPLVGSITVPTTPVSFVLNPNEEVGQQFIAPEFSVTNETTAPIRLTLNNFEQTTNVLTDVLPDKYNRWEGLNKKESKNIALALVPKAGDGWLSLNEEPRYVADTLNNDLGVIKAKSSVDFTFSALHGQAFEEVLNPSYRLGFVFEFMS